MENALKIFNIVAVAVCIMPMVSVIVLRAIEKYFEKKTKYTQDLLNGVSTAVKEISIIKKENDPK